jgi:integrase
LIPAFGATPIQALTAEKIERWQAGLLLAPRLRAAPRPAIAAEAKTPPTRPLSPRSVQICRVVLGAILKDARIKGRLYRDPMEAVQAVTVPKRELHYLTPEQIKALCQAVGAFYAVLFLTMAFCGLRFGEVLGLQWPDVDLERRRLFIRRQVVWHRKTERTPEQAPWAFTEPKTEAAKRVVEIPETVARFLAAHRAEQSGRPNPHALVFPSETGAPLTPSHISRTHFTKPLKALGITGIRPHDFRRTFIAMHVEAGTHPKLVQARVGHTNIALTMDVYGKLAGSIALSAEQAARVEAATQRALPEFAPAPAEPPAACRVA